MELAQRTVGSALEHVRNIKTASQGLLYDVYRLAYGPEGAALLQGTVPNLLGEMLVKLKPNDPGVPFLTLLPSGWPEPSTTPQQLLNLLAMPHTDNPMYMIWLLLPLLAGHVPKADSRARLHNRWCKQTQSIRALYSAQLHQQLAEFAKRDTVPAAWLEEICKCLSGSGGLAADEAQDWPLLRQLVQAFKEGDDHTTKGWSKAWQKIQDGSSCSQQSLNPSKEQPSHTSPNAGSSSAVADEDAELKTNAEETLAEMKEVRRKLLDIKAALTAAATSSNYPADIKTHQNSINTEEFALYNMISSLTEHLRKQNWVVLGQQLDKYQELLQQAKDKVCDAESALAAVKYNDAAKVTQLPLPSSSQTTEEPPSKKQRSRQSPSQQSQGGAHTSAEPSVQQPGVSGLTTGTGAAPTPTTPSTTTASAGNEGSCGESMSASRSGQPGPSAVRPGSRAIQRQQHQPNMAAAAEIAGMLHTKLVEVKMSMENGSPEDASAAFSEAQQQLEKLQKAMEDVKRQFVDHATI